MAKTSKAPPRGDRRVIAFHEAGHAVAAILLGHRVLRVYLFTDTEQGLCGTAVHRRRGPSLLNDARMTPRALDEALVEVQVAFAGAEAACRVTGRWDNDAATDDNLTIFGLAELVCEHGGAEERDAFLGWLHLRVKALLQKPGAWEAVEAIAAALLEHDRLP